MMKYVFILMLLVQTAIGQIPKNTNTIAVKGVSFVEVCTALVDSGYFVIEKDNELQIAKTEPKKYPKYWDGTYIMKVRVKDSIAFFTSTFTVATMFRNEEVSYVWKNLSRKSMVGVPFYIMDRFAKGFNRPVEYLKQ